RRGGRRGRRRERRPSRGRRTWSGLAAGVGGGRLRQGYRRAGLDASASYAALLAHCYKCGHYPLIIGLNPTCIRCHGLVCEYADGGVPCHKCCKRGCPGPGGTLEADFVEGPEERGGAEGRPTRIDDFFGPG